MKVLDLHCEQGHGFEGWFNSEQDFQSQLGSGLLTCPVCGSAELTKRLSAPRLNLSSGHSVAAPAGEPPAQTSATAVAPSDKLQAAWMQVVRHVMENTEDVGPRFVEEARRMHYGEAKERGIRGQASAQDAVALKEEGIEVMSLPLPAGMKGPVQ